jgi:hypothetical protein
VVGVDITSKNHGQVARDKLMGIGILRFLVFIVVVVVLFSF